MEPRAIRRAILAQAGGPVPPPDLLHLRLTFRCNARCIMCVVRPGGATRPGPFPVAADAALSLDSRTISRLLGEARDLGVRRVTLQGGEPSLHPDFADLLVEAASMGFDVKTFTNGSAHLDAIARALAALRDGRTLTVNLSVDGLGDMNDRIRGTPGLFERASELARGIAALSGRNPKLLGYVYTVVMRENAASLVEIANYFFGIGLRVVFHPVHVYGPCLDGEALRPVRYLPEGVEPGPGEIERVRGLIDVLEWHPGVGNCLGLRYMGGLYSGPSRKLCIVSSVGLFVNADGWYVGCPNLLPRLGRAGEVRMDEMWRGGMEPARRVTFLNCHVPCVGSYCLDQILPSLED